MYEATFWKVSEFKSVADYTNIYQAVFDKIASLLTDFFFYKQNRIEAHFQATILMNIGKDYLDLISSIL